MKSFFIPNSMQTEIPSNWDELLNHKLSEISTESSLVKIWVSPPNQAYLSKIIAQKNYSVEILPLLWVFVNENFVDSVEFRRLARRFFRKSKSEHITDFIFFDWKNLTPRNKKIIQHMAGKKIKIHFI